MTRAVNTALAIALDHGLRVFPCRPRDKQPLTEHGCKDATTDRAQIDDWKRRFRESNWGAATGDGLIALDLDSKNGGDGFAVAAKLETEYGPLPATLINVTPNSGEHRLFHGPAVRNSANKIGAGFDVRGDGGYIIIPPSRLATGDYRWLDPTARIADAPAWLIEKLINTSRTIPAGHRNDSLSRFAFKLRRHGTPEDEAWRLLQVRNQDCDPPLDESELRKIFNSAWRCEPGYELNDLGNALRLIDQHHAAFRYVVGRRIFLL